MSCRKAFRLSFKCPKCGRTSMDYVKWVIRMPGNYWMAVTCRKCGRKVTLRWDCTVEDNHPQKGSE